MVDIQKKNYSVETIKIEDNNTSKSQNSLSTLREEVQTSLSQLMQGSNETESCVSKKDNKNGKNNKNKKQEKQKLKMVNYSQVKNFDEIFINYFLRRRRQNNQIKIREAEDKEEISKNKRKYDHLIKNGQIQIVSNVKEKQVNSLHDELFNFLPEQVTIEQKKRLKATISIVKPGKFLNPFSIYLLKNGYVIDEEMMTKIINKEYHQPVATLRANNYFKSIDFVMQDKTDDGHQFTSIYLKEIQDNVVSMDYIVERFNSFETSEYKFLSDNIGHLEDSFRQIQVSNEKPPIIKSQEKFFNTSKIAQNQELMKELIKQNNNLPIFIMQFDLTCTNRLCDFQNIHVSKSFLEKLDYTQEEFTEIVLKNGITDLHAYKNPQQYYQQLRQLFLSMLNKVVEDDDKAVNEDETLYVFIKKDGSYVEIDHSKVWWVTEPGISFYGARFESN